MDNLQIFENEEFGEVRTISVNNKPYVMLNDVCEILDIKNVSDVKARLKKDGVVNNEVMDRLGRTQVATFINEGNLYKVIFQSRKPQAEQFIEWVTSEVLPSIRQHGGYGVQTIPTDLQILQGMLNKLIQQETEIKVISEQTQAIKDTIVAEYDNWREEIKRQINTIQKKSAMTYQDTYNTLYDGLEKRARCDLSARVRNGRDRLADSGATKTKIEAFGRMDVIEADARLKEIFTTIVKEYAVKYVV